MCLFLDEFDVIDTADAHIVTRLFELLFQNGVVLVTVSSHLPEDLYADGIQRRSFLPFIPLLRRHSQVVPVDADQDFRLRLIDKERQVFSRLYHGRKFRRGSEQVLQTYFCLIDPNDLEQFR